MRLKRIIFIIFTIIIVLLLMGFLGINILVYKNKGDNKKVIHIYNNFFLEQELDISLYSLPKLEISGTDYVGIIDIKNNSILPVEENCSNYFFKSSCIYSYTNESLIILGTMLENSFSSYSSYNVGDSVIFGNMLGQKFKYKINKIKREDKLEDLLLYDNDLIIGIKNYLVRGYVLLMCDFY